MLNSGSVYWRSFRRTRIPTALMRLSGNSDAQLRMFYRRATNAAKWHLHSVLSHGHSAIAGILLSIRSSWKTQSGRVGILRVSSPSKATLLAGMHAENRAAEE